MGRVEGGVGKEKKERKDKPRGTGSRAELGRRRRGGKSDVTKEEAKEKNLLILQTHKCSLSSGRKSLYFESAVRGLLSLSVREGNYFLPVVSQVTSYIKPRSLGGCHL